MTLITLILGAQSSMGHGKSTGIGGNFWIYNSLLSNIEMGQRFIWNFLLLGLDVGQWLGNGMGGLDSMKNGLGTQESKGTV